MGANLTDVSATITLDPEFETSTKRDAQLIVAGRAQDNDDCRYLLQVLGLFEQLVA